MHYTSVLLCRLVFVYFQLFLYDSIHNVTYNYNNNNDDDYYYYYFTTTTTAAASAAATKPSSKQKYSMVVNAVLLVA